MPASDARAIARRTRSLRTRMADTANLPPHRRKAPGGSGVGRAEASSSRGRPYQSLNLYINLERGRSFGGSKALRSAWRGLSEAGEGATGVRRHRGGDVFHRLAAQPGDLLDDGHDERWRVVSTAT